MTDQPAARPSGLARYRGVRRDYLGLAGRSPRGQRHHAGPDQVEAREEAGELTESAARLRDRAEPLVVPPLRLAGLLLVDVLGRIRDHQIAARRDRGKEPRHDSPGIVGVRDVLQDQYVPNLLVIVISKNPYSKDPERGNVRNVTYADVSVTGR